MRWSDPSGNALAAYNLANQIGAKAREGFKYFYNNYFNRKFVTGFVGGMLGWAVGKFIANSLLGVNSRSEDILFGIINTSDLFIAGLIGAATELTNAAIPEMYSINIMKQSKKLLQFYGATGISMGLGTVASIKDAALTPIYIQGNYIDDGHLRIITELSNDIGRILLTSLASGAANVAFSPLSEAIHKRIGLDGLSAFLTMIANGLVSGFISAGGDIVDSTYDPNEMYSPSSR